jgi:hypothetical protein
MVLTVVVFFLPSEKSGLVSGLLSIGRALLILMSWFFILAPMLTYFIRRYLLKKQAQNSADVSYTLKNLNLLRSAVSPAWKLAGAEYKGLSRCREFVVILILVSFELPHHAA